MGVSGVGIQLAVHLIAAVVEVTASIDVIHTERRVVEATAEGMRRHGQCCCCSCCCCGSNRQRRMRRRRRHHNLLRRPDAVLS